MTELEVNVYFERSILQEQKLVQLVEDAASSILLLDTVDGLVGNQNNVVTMGIRSNQITKSELDELESSITNRLIASDLPLTGINEIEIIG